MAGIGAKAEGRVIDGLIVFAVTAVGAVALAVLLNSTILAWVPVVFAYSLWQALRRRREAGR